MIVTKNREQKAKKKFDKETESIRPFHQGSLRRCPECGRKVFLPCLACTVEQECQIPDPFDRPNWVSEMLRIQLQGEERQRYEYIRLEKIAETVRRESQEETSHFLERSVISGTGSNHETDRTKNDRTE